MMQHIQNTIKIFTNSYALPSIYAVNNHVTLRYTIGLDFSCPVSIEDNICNVQFVSVTSLLLKKLTLYNSHLTSTFNTMVIKWYLFSLE